jgi:DNA-binding PucR family transcriptional regulator
MNILRKFQQEIWICFKNMWMIEHMEEIWLENLFFNFKRWKGKSESEKNFELDEDNFIDQQEFDKKLWSEWKFISLKLLVTEFSLSFVSKNLFLPKKEVKILNSINEAEKLKIHKSARSWWIKNLFWNFHFFSVTFRNNNWLNTRNKK